MYLGWSALCLFVQLAADAGLAVFRAQDEALAAADAGGALLTVQETDDQVLLADEGTAEGDHVHSGKRCKSYCR